MSRAPRSPSAPAQDSWPGRVALVAVVALSVAACLRKIWAIDFWWQLATGRYIVEQGWPQVDVFSYTATGQPWIEMRGLFCVAQYAWMTLAGPNALIFLQWLVVAFTFFGIGFLAIRPARPLAVAGVTLLALLASSERLFVRPELVTWCLLAVFLTVLHRDRQQPSRRIWILVPLQVLWVNAHTLFILGTLIVGLWALVGTVEAVVARGRAGALVTRARVIRSSVVFVAVFLAGLLNPYGVRGLLFPLQLFAELRGTLFKEIITEFHSPWTLGLGSHAVRVGLVLLVLVVASAIVNWRRLDAFLGLNCLAQVYLAQLSVRNLPLFCISAVPFVLSNLERSGLWERLAARPSARVLRRVAALLIVGVAAWYSLAMVTGRFYVAQNDSNQPGFGIAEHRYPIRAVEFLDRAQIGGRVFGTLLENSYLVWAGYPVFVDPRLEVYGETWYRRFLDAQMDVGAWRATASEFDIRAVVLDIRSPLAGILGRLDDWELVYFDEVAAVYVAGAWSAGLESLREPAAFARALARVRESLPPPRPWREAGFFSRVTAPHPYLAVCDFLLGRGDADGAESFLRDAEAAAPFAPGLALRRANLYELREDWAGVVAAARAGLVETPDDPRLALRLGSASMRLGDRATARTWLERAAEAQPDRAATWGLLANVHIADEAFDQAEDALVRAVAADGANVVYRLNLAQVQGRLGRPREAQAILTEALAIAPDHPRVLRDLTLFAAAAGDEVTVRRLLPRALALAPEDPRLRELAGRLGAASPAR